MKRVAIMLRNGARLTCSPEYLAEWVELGAVPVEGDREQPTRAEERLPRQVDED